MKRSLNVLAFTRLFMTTIGAVLTLALFLLILHPRVATAAQILLAEDPEVVSLSISSSLPISMAEVSGQRLLYFNNVTSGTLSVTFEISGTPPITLTAGGAFDEPLEVYTSANSAPSFPLTYTVLPTHATQAGVPYTVSSTVSDTRAWITYVQDITPPTVTIGAPPGGYFTETETVITGTTGDCGGAGVEGVQLSIDGMISPTILGPMNWYLPVSFPPADGKAYTVTAYATDYLQNVMSATRVITVDTLAPTGTVVFTPSLPIGEWSGTGTLAMEWHGFQDGGKIAGYEYLISDTTAVTLPLPSSSFTTIPSATLMAPEGASYFHLAAVDKAGNWSTTRYTGPFQVDLTPPTVVLTAPQRVGGGAFALSWQGQDGLSGVVSYTLAYKRAGTGWQAIPLTAPLQTTAVFTPTHDETTYTFRVTAYDAVGNEGVDEDTTRVGRYTLYIPALTRNWAAWYEKDRYEPNDTPATAYPVEADQTYRAYIYNEDDEDDYYKLEDDRPIRVELFDIAPDADYDLYIYRKEGNSYDLIAWSYNTGTAMEEAEFDAQAGEAYYIRVYPYDGFSKDHLYSLEITAGN